MPETSSPNPQPALVRYLPGVALLRGYERRWLRKDILAGISVCVVMIPSVIAYAGLMGIPPEHGLYAALVPLLVYPFLGSSRQVIVGPDIAISLLIASTVGPIAGGDAGRAATLAATLAVLSGFILLLGARMKLGVIADFLSKPVLLGYMTGAALILLASQLDKLFGIALKNRDFFPRLVELGGQLHRAHGPTLLLGAGLLGLILVLRRLARRVPPALVVVVVAALASLLLKLESQGVTVVGAFPRGLPKVTLPAADWTQIHLLLPAAMGIALLTYAEGILLARAFATKNGYEVNANQELTALGLADVATGLFQGFSVTGSQARTAVSHSAGGKTQVVSLVAAAALMLFLLFLTPVMSHVPVVALAVILIYGSFTLVEFPAMARIYRLYPGSGVLAGLTTLSVLVVGVVPGILVGVALSLLGLINRVSHPPDAVLSEVPGQGFHDMGDTGRVETLPGLVAYRFYAPLLFSNAGYFVQRVRELVGRSQSPVRWFLLDAQAITDIDVTAAEALHSLNEELRKQGIEMKVAHANPPLRALLQRTGLVAEIGKESFFDSVHECVEAFGKRGA